MKVGLKLILTTLLILVLGTLGIIFFKGSIGFTFAFISLLSLGGTLLLNKIAE
jgi:hypothetical protein